MITVCGVSWFLFLALDLLAMIWARDYAPSGWRRFVPGSGFIASLDRVEAAKHSRRVLILSFKEIRPGSTMILRDADGNEWSLMWRDDMEHIAARANMRFIDAVADVWTWQPPVHK